MRQLVKPPWVAADAAPPPPRLAPTLPDHRRESLKRNTGEEITSNVEMGGIPRVELLRLNSF